MYSNFLRYRDSILRDSDVASSLFVLWFGFASSRCSEIVFCERKCILDVLIVMLIVVLSSSLRFTNPDLRERCFTSPGLTNTRFNERFAVDLGRSPLGFALEGNPDRVKL